ncbi:MAG: peptidoglycan DD-metalloendopeptidase family protein [Ruminococcus sp.]|nr:peptidoglycan DD-metalloendopeptidase family protein [Ruminococcus sp.]
MGRVSSIKRIIACLAAVVTVISVTSASSRPLISEKVAMADDHDAVIAELDEQAKEKQKKIKEAKDKLKELEKKQAELDEQINTTQNDIEDEEKKQAAIEEQITTVEETIRALESSIQALAERIDSLTKEIAQKEEDIAVKKQEITDGVRDFQKRIRAMYIAGSESYTDILVGASDFYDMLMKLELIKRVADHDNGVIEDLIDKKNQYEADEKALEESKAALEADQNDLMEQQKKQEDQKDKLDDLFLQSRAMIEQLEYDKAAFMANQEQTIAEQEAFEDDIQKLFKEQEELKKAKAAEEELKRKEEEERKRKEEEERKRREEEERKRKEEEERKRREELLRRQQEEQNNSPTVPTIPSSDSGSDDSDSESSSPSGGNKSNAPYNYTDKSQFTWPCPGFYYISYGVGPRWGSYHQGIDIYSPNIRGAAICAAADGTVIRAVNGCPHDFGKNYSCGCGGGYGNYCVIDHGGGWWTLYGHSEGITVSVGQQVKKGDVLGTVGSTGHSTGPHLHFEVRLNGVALDPQQYV